MDELEFEILRDIAIAGTPLRGLIARGPFSLLAYVGVPENHWLADMDEFQFECHYGETYRGAGDGVFRPKGWYWFGWDYGHFGDHQDLTRMFQGIEIPPELRELLENSPLAKGKRWTVEEVEQEVFDAAMSIREALDEAHRVAQGLTEGLRSAQK